MLEILTWGVGALMGGLAFMVMVLSLKGRSNKGSLAPPLVTSSPFFSIPFFGTILEFGQSPVKFVRRCYDETGPVFTVPVRFVIPSNEFMTWNQQ
jgi:hypothetical protein